MAEPVKEPSMPQPVDIVNIVFGIAMTHATCFTPLLRKRPGTRAYAIYGPLALMMMYGYAGFGQAPQLLLYIPVWLFFVIYRRVFANRVWISSFQGLSIGTGWFGHNTARLLESILLFALGVFLYPTNEGLGNFVAAGALSTFIVHMTELQAADSLRRRMHDAQCDMRYQAWIQKGGR